jgi:hypothetical protein
MTDKTVAFKTSSNRMKPASTFIQVNEDYAIDSDSYSWYVLQRRRYKGGYKWEQILWFGTLEQCVHGLWHRAVQTCGAQSLGMATIVIHKIKRLRRRVDQGRDVRGICVGA